MHVLTLYTLALQLNAHILWSIHRHPWYSIDHWVKLVHCKYKYPLIHFELLVDDNFCNKRYSHVYYHNAVLVLLLLPLSIRNTIDIRLTLAWNISAASESSDPICKSLASSLCKLYINKNQHNTTSASLTEVREVAAREEDLLVTRDPAVMSDFDLLPSPVEDLVFSKADFNRDSDCCRGGSGGHDRLLLSPLPCAVGKLLTY